MRCIRSINRNYNIIWSCWFKSLFLYYWSSLSVASSYSTTDSTLLQVIFKWLLDLPANIILNTSLDWPIRELIPNQFKNSHDKSGNICYFNLLFNTIEIDVLFWTIFKLMTHDYSLDLVLNDILFFLVLE